jgi:hypothetical protein
MAAGVVINLLNLPFSLTALQRFSLLCVIAGRHRNLFDILRLIDRAGGPFNAKEILGSRGTSQQSAELPMNGLERRLTPRIEWLADIHFEPNNGGIVLDLSEGGLSFHAIDPIQTDSTIHFSVSLHDQRIQATGELAWIIRRLAIYRPVRRGSPTSS